MTISKLAKLNKANGGFFFDKESMKANGESLMSFTVDQNPEFPEVLTVRRNRDVARFSFSKSTGRIVHGFINSAR